MTPEEYAQRVAESDFHFPHPNFKKFIEQAYRAGKQEMIDKVCDLMIGMLNEGIIETRDIGKVNTMIRKYGKQEE